MKLSAFSAQKPLTEVRKSFNNVNVMNTQFVIATRTVIVTNFD